VANCDNPLPLSAGFEPADTVLGIHSFTGTLDEIDIFNRAQSPGEILGIYSANRQGLLPGGSGDALVSDAPLTAGAFSPPNATETMAISKAILFPFSDADVEALTTDFTATVTWGDGTSNATGDGTGNVSIVADRAGGFDVVGSHTYAQAGADTFSVVVTDKGGAAPLT